MAMRKIKTICHCLEISKWISLFVVPNFDWQSQEQEKGLDAACHILSISTLFQKIEQSVRVAEFTIFLTSVVDPTV